MIIKFVIRLLLFLIPLGIGILILEFSLRAIPNDYAFKNEMLTQRAAEVEILFMGNSHAYRGIVSENLDFNAFNAAYISQSLDIDLLLFNHYAPQLKELDYLFLNISYHTLFSSITTSKEKWRLKNYNIYYDQHLTLNPINYTEFFSNKFAVNKERFVNHYLRHKNSITSTSLGSGTAEGRQDLEATAISAAKRHTKEGLPYYKDHLKSLQRVVDYCKERQIDIILMTSPVHSSYFNRLDTVQLNRMNRILDSLESAHENIHRLNLIRSNLYDATDFRNADHLNKKGAEKFTNQINQYLKDVSL